MRARDAFRLLVESNRVGSSGWIINPIVYTNQVQEDLFGRPSRLSRRVNIKGLHWNVIRRTLIVYQTCLLDSDSDTRGLDSFEDV